MKLKKLTHSAFAASICLLSLAACNKGEEQDPVTNNVIRVAANINKPESRAGMTTENLNSFYINIEGATPKYSYCAMMSKTDAQLTPTIDWRSYHPSGNTPYTPLTMLWQNNTTPIYVTAAQQNYLFLTKDSFDNGCLITIKEDQSTHMALQSSDLLYMPRTAVNPATDLVDGKVNVTLSHRLSKINLTITLNNEFNLNNGTDTNPILDLTINNTQVCAVFKAKTNELTLQNDTKPVAPLATAFAPGSGTTTKAVAAYEVILLPQTVEAGKFSVSFTINGKLYAWASATAVTLDPGKEYSLKLTAGYDIVNLQSITTTPWTDGGESDLETE